MRRKLLPLTVVWVAVVALPNQLWGTSNRGAAIVSEIDQLHNAFQAYKEKHLVYPPCLGESDPDVRKRQFMEHVRKVYPYSAYGVRAVDFDNLATYISANYKVSTDEGTVSLDLHSLDPAEALVFWLGGFPTPIATGTGGGAPIAPSRLFGFNKDSDSPLTRSVAQEGTEPLATRTESTFKFVQDRLVDNDDDGWWEYLTPPVSSEEMFTPFVYFDSATYQRSSTSPDLLGTVLYPTDPTLVAAYGTIVPFAETYDPANKLAFWKNSDSFQIVCGGYDGKFSAPATGARIELFPGGKTYRGPTFVGPAVDCDEEELDNLTNLARTTLSGNDPYSGIDVVFFLRYAFPMFVLLLAILFVAAFLLRMSKSTRSPAEPFSGPGSEPVTSATDGRRPR
jgi:hypothetical protein